MKRLNNVVVLLASIILTVLMLEITMHIIYGIRPKEITHFSLSSSDYYRKDAELKWIPESNVHGVHNKQGSFSSSFSTNSRGLRDKEYYFKKTDGVKRIVVLGDSFTWGFGVNDDEIYTEKLESMLLDTEVINLGVTAYQLWQEIIYLMREGVQYDPDIIIVGLSLNDIVWRKSGAEVDTTREPRKKEDNAFYLRKFLKKYLINKSALASFILDRINTNRTLIKAMVNIGLKDSLTDFKGLDINLMTSLRVYPEILNRCWDDTESELLYFKRISDKLGARLIIAVIPSVQSINQTSFNHSISHSIYNAEDFDLNKPYRYLKEIAASNDLDIVLPVSEFREMYKQGKQLYHERDMHFNTEGHELFARLIAKHLEDQSYAE